MNLTKPMENRVDPDKTTRISWIGDLSDNNSIAWISLLILRNRTNLEFWGILKGNSWTYNKSE